ncbi:YkvI family membrane protein [Aminicella lysinilytica]|uniref:Putative membrane protein YkvI n=1 Tax=Aminicella lysinilytica TaxID=433323 RepID=A0A4V3CR17_9FIRM|nr:hypothetical protein [Aminicella lysinilytica]TDP53012.1 putative membrane protein YkvI [Aminicella lysinilytica]
MKEKVSIGNILKFSGAFVACAIGSGFATGQEIMQFFSAYGVMGIAGTAITTVIFAWVGGMFMKHGYEQQLREPGDIIPYYFGQRFGKLFQIILQVFLYGVFVIMIAGAGATLSEYFGLNPMVGRVGMALLAFFTVILGLTKVTDILGTLGTVIIIFAVGIGIYSLVANASNLSASLALIPTLEMTKTQGGWLVSGILYPAFNAVVVVILASSIGKSANSAREARLGGTIGGVLFGLAVMIMNLGIVANIGGLYTKAVPTLVIAQEFSPVFGVIFSVIICCGIYTTTVPMLWGVVRQFANDGTKKFVAMAFGLTVIGLILGMTDFKVLVNSIYPLSGYLGVIMFGFVMYRQYQRKHPVEIVEEQIYEDNKVLPLRKIS